LVYKFKRRGIFIEKLHELNEELERLNAEAHDLEEKIAENVVKIMEERQNE
jgi:type I restriction enzyme M protein